MNYDEKQAIETADEAVRRLNDARGAGDTVGDDVDFIVREMQSIAIEREKADAAKR